MLASILGASFANVTKTVLAVWRRLGPAGHQRNGDATVVLQSCRVRDGEATNSRQREPDERPEALPFCWFNMSEFSGPGGGEQYRLAIEFVSAPQRRAARR